MATVAPGPPDITVFSGTYGSLTLLLTPAGAQAAAAAAAELKAPVEPPQSHPITDQSWLVIKEWWLYFYAIVSYFSALIAGIVAPPAPVQILAPSIDEVDAEWYVTGTVGTSDPETFTATMVGQSRFPIQMVVTKPGAAYATAPTIVVAGANGTGWASGAIATVAAGKLVAISPPTHWYGLQAPLTVTITGGGGSGAAATAKLGRQFAVGDFGVWNDPTVATDGSLQYEVDQITAIAATDATHAQFTIARMVAGAAGGAQYGSKVSAHTGCAFYRLQNELFEEPFRASADPQILNFPWPSMCVAAVIVAIPGYDPVTINLAPNVYLPGTTTPNPRTTPPAPGLRTMNGAAYTSMGITGALTVGALTTPISAQAWESVRQCYAKVLAAPAGAVTFGADANAAIVLYILFIEDQTGVVGLLDTVVIDTATLESYPLSDAPDGRNMPRHFYWPFTAPNADFPPNRLPVVTSGLTTPVVVDPSTTIVFRPDGLIRGLVAQIGSATAGSDLIATVQT